MKPGTALDQEASKRATSTYLVQKVSREGWDYRGPFEFISKKKKKTTTNVVLMQVIPMLPRQLCEHLCSLNPNEVCFPRQLGLARWCCIHILTHVPIILASLYSRQINNQRGSLFLVICD